MHDRDHDDRDHDAAREWDRFYVGGGDDTPHWSGRANPTLVAETAALAPGRALDVGCGEGADAIWLARHGWRVTAVDPSGIALRRARVAADAAGVEIAWVRAGLLDLPDDTLPYDLVSAHYPVLRRGDGDGAIRALFRAVAPGGTLLFVHHELDRSHAAEHGFDPSDHVMPDTLAAAFDDEWDVQTLGARQRVGSGGATRGGPRDIVLRAKRRAAQP